MDFFKFIYLSVKQLIDIETDPCCVNKYALMALFGKWKQLYLLWRPEQTYTGLFNKKCKMSSTNQIRLRSSPRHVVE